MTQGNNQIYITCSVDRNKKFQEITAVMLYSMIKNLDPTRSAYVYILHEPKDIVTLENYCKKIGQQFENIQFEFVEVDSKIFEDKKIPTYNNLPMGTYYRLLVPELINQEKILYLDGDMLINKDISKLWDIGLGDYLLAGVKTNVLKPRMENIQVDNYINAGMMLINLKGWADDHIGYKCIEFCVDHPMGISGNIKIMGDQCAINKICEGKIKFVDPIYNQTPMCFRWDLNYDQLGYDKNKYIQAIKNPTIIHFAGVDKPRKSNSLHPYNKLWGKYYQELTKKRDVGLYLIQSITNTWNLNSPIYHSYVKLKNKIKNTIGR